MANLDEEGRVMARPLSEEQMVEGLLAGLVLLGDRQVVTEYDEHHRRFANVIAELESARRAGTPGAEDMPGALRANGVTGRFRELDAALGRLQSGGMIGAANPLYPAVDLNAGPRTAQKLFERFYTPEQAQLLQRLARVYREAVPAAV
jgi:hypothetical protein